MLHKYKKIVPIEAEQFDGTKEMKDKYQIVDKAELTSAYYQGESRYFLPTREGDMKIEKGRLHRYWRGWRALGYRSRHIRTNLREGGLMLTTQARLAMRNNQPVRLVGDLYHIIDIKRVNGTSRMIATIKKIGLTEWKYESIDVDIEYLERA